MKNKYLNNLEYSFENGVLEFRYNKDIKEGFVPHAFRILTIKNLKYMCRPHFEEADKLSFDYEFAIYFENSKEKSVLTKDTIETLDEIFKGFYFLLNAIISNPNSFPSKAFLGNDTNQLLNGNGLAYSLVKWNNDSYDISFRNINSEKGEVSMSFYDLNLEDLKVLRDGLSKIL